MEMTEILGYFGALIVGLVLGLIGGGGSILTVPILVYFLNFSPIVATAYSLFVVGSAASVGTLKNIRHNYIDFKTAIVFAIPSIITVFMVRSLVIPNLPEILFSIGSFKLTNSLFIMLLFAVIMLLAGWSMIKSKEIQDETVIKKFDSNHYFAIGTQAIGIGLLAGLVGAGGGFLIVPALVLIVKLPIKKAISTSLFIIAIQSLIGFLGDIKTLDIDWHFLLSFTAISILGIFIGLAISKKISAKGLKRGFGYFTIIMAVYILFKELF
ncbi:sulfite exporter TauE/SafE family protein [Winogradskyella echinorum]|uniref:Probable membrane transporter protein n=1 Tax=Winogradskyella echinorum TaxID=538189 RepID=A0ABR6XWV7_9FLAO|nr:sulfite exporter TauE/SafE family protein [Winogradskyella echinorum]MBC3844975.1 sulfite exporter TauE/SafE family protein [Winogradskyella echinorum]MBC5749323.1 sulfite exporter TauE/SafE family protein [Winogradskyella echinorum]